MRLAVLAAATTLVAVALAPAAAAAGLPVLGIDDGSSGVTVPGALSRYVTIPARGGTLVERINRNGGQVLVASLFSGTYTIPAVAYDSTAGGLSGDRHTLVLIEPRNSFPRQRTKLLVLHTPSLRYQSTIDLKGDFSFDAVSPDGSRILLINYLSPTDPTRYAVRSFNLAAMRLEPKPIVDPTNPREKMRGNPVSRATSVDGRRAYTLYDGGGGEPFVHALDTSSGAARCIDLDGLNRVTLWRDRLMLTGGGRRLEIHDGVQTLLTVDTRSYAVRAPRGGAFPWLTVLGVALAGVAFGGFALWLVSRSRGAAASSARDGVSLPAAVRLPPPAASLHAASEEPPSLLAAGRGSALSHARGSGAASAPPGRRRAQPDQVA